MHHALCWITAFVTSNKDVRNICIDQFGEPSTQLKQAHLVWACPHCAYCSWWVVTCSMSVMAPTMHSTPLSLPHSPVCHFNTIIEIKAKVDKSTRVSTFSWACNDKTAEKQYSKHCTSYTKTIGRVSSTDVCAQNTHIRTHYAFSSVSSAHLSLSFQPHPPEM